MLRSSRLFILVILMLIPTASRADIGYTFIKVSCNPDSQTVTLRGFYASSDAEGAKMAKSHEKNIYYLDDISGYTELNENVPLRGEITACDFGQGQIVSFIARRDLEHPRGDGLRLFLNNKQTHGWFSLANGEWTLEIHSLGANKFDLNRCYDNYVPINEQKCHSWSIDTDKLVEPILHKS